MEKFDNDLTIPEAAELAKVTATCLRKWIARGLTLFGRGLAKRRIIKLRSHRLGGRIRVKQSDLEAFLRKTETNSIAN